MKKDLETLTSNFDANGVPGLDIYNQIASQQNKRNSDGTYYNEQLPKDWVESMVNSQTVEDFLNLKIQTAANNSYFTEEILANADANKEKFKNRIRQELESIYDLNDKVFNLDEMQCALRYQDNWRKHCTHYRDYIETAKYLMDILSPYNNKIHQNVKDARFDDYVVGLYVGSDFENGDVTQQRYYSMNTHDSTSDEVYDQYSSSEKKPFRTIIEDDDSYDDYDDDYNYDTDKYNYDSDSYNQESTTIKTDSTTKFEGHLPQEYNDYNYEYGDSDSETSTNSVNSTSRTTARKWNTKKKRRRKRSNFDNDSEYEYDEYQSILADPDNNLYVTTDGYFWSGDSDSNFDYFTDAFNIRDNPVRSMFTASNFDWSNGQYTEDIPNDSNIGSYTPTFGWNYQAAFKANENLTISKALNKFGWILNQQSMPFLIFKDKTYAPKEAFKMEYTSEGVCFTLNQDAAKQVYFEQKVNGQGNGLTIGINLMQNSYTELQSSLYNQDKTDPTRLNQDAGAKIYIYHENEPFAPLSNPISLLPGVKTHISMEKFIYNYMHKPWGDCDLETKSKKYEFYTENACLQYCYVDQIYKFCSCLPGYATTYKRYTTLAKYKNATECSLKQIISNDECFENIQKAKVSLSLGKVA